MVEGEEAREAGDVDGGAGCAAEGGDPLGDDGAGCVFVGLSFWGVLAVVIRGLRTQEPRRVKSPRFVEDGCRLERGASLHFLLVARSQTRRQSRCVVLSVMNSRSETPLKVLNS